MTFFCALMVALIVILIDCLVPMLKLYNVLYLQTLGIYEQIIYSRKFGRVLAMKAMLVVMVIVVVERMMVVDGARLIKMDWLVKIDLVAELR